MSYSYRMVADVFYIPRENVGKALVALRNRRWEYLEFAQRSEEVRRAESLPDVMAAFGLSADVDGDGNLDGLAADETDWSDQEALFDALAPYVGEGSELSFFGEDGANWEYLFDGKRIHKKYY